MYIVLMGCGRLGAQLASQLSAKDHDVVMIDENPSAFKKLGSGFNGVTVVGTGIDIEVQRKAGMADADAFAALSSDDNTNIMAAQVAKEIYHVPKVIARILDPKRENVYHQLGLESICPTNVGADIVRNFIESDTLCCRLNFAHFGVVEFTAGKAMIGKKVAEIDVAGQVRMMTVTRGEAQTIASPDWVIAEGDVLMATIANHYRQEFKRRWLDNEFSLHRFLDRFKEMK